MTDSRIPFLLWTDAPDKPTGLARICRDLAWHMYQDPAINQVYRVGTFGFFGSGSAHFPWTQYTASSVEDGMAKLPDSWADFTSLSPNPSGVLFTITPPTWIFPLVLPEMSAKERPKQKELWEWYINRPYKHWAYLAIESHTPGPKYSLPVQRVIEGVDRRLFYSRWGAQIAATTTDAGDCDYLPHGIFCSQFFPQSAELIAAVRRTMNADPQDVLIGCVATNTQRKNLGLLFESFDILRRHLLPKGRRPRLWLHTNVAIGEWSLPALCEDYGLTDKVDYQITSTLAQRPDSWLSGVYSAMDIVVMPTDGEGFGYPVVEALACGTPVVTGSFGAQAMFLEHFRPQWLCPPVSLNLYGTNNLIRPAYRPAEFADCILTALSELDRDGPQLRAACAEQAALWDWKAVWPYWRKWLLDGQYTLQPKEITNVQPFPNPAPGGDSPPADSGGADSSAPTA